MNRRRAAAPYVKALFALAKERMAAAVVRVAQRVRSACSRRAVCLAVPLVMLLPLVLATSGLVHHIYFDRSGVVRIPEGTAHSLYGPDFPIRVMGKTGTTSDFRDALFVGSTYGPQGVTVADRIGFDDNRTLGDQETGGRAALPIFREIMRMTYQQELVGSAPAFPHEIEDEIDRYLKRRPRDRDLGDPPLEDLNRNVATLPHHQSEQSR